MDGPQVRQNLKFLFGDRWRKDAPRQLRTSESTIERWMSGGVRGPAEVAILLLVQRRKQYLSRKRSDRAMTQRYREREGVSDVK